MIACALVCVSWAHTHHTEALIGYAFVYSRCRWLVTTPLYCVRVYRVSLYAVMCSVLLLSWLILWWCRCRCRCVCLAHILARVLCDSMCACMCELGTYTPHRSLDWICVCILSLSVACHHSIVLCTCVSCILVRCDVLCVCVILLFFACVTPLCSHRARYSGKGFRARLFIAVEFHP